MTAPTQATVEIHKRIATCLGAAMTSCDAKVEQTRFAGAPWTPVRCPACTNTLTSIRNMDRELVAADERLSAQTRRLKALNIPPIYARATLDQFEYHGPSEDQRLQRRAQIRAGQFIDRWEQRADPDSDFPQIVVFRGAPGSGKGHLAWAITRAIVTDSEVRAEFDTCANIIRDLRQSWGRPASEATELDRLKHYRELDLLVIDEVSRHALYGEPARHLYDLLAHREQWLRPTIITTNETLEELGTILQDALVSRIEGWGGIYEFGAADYRIERRKRRAKVAS